MRLLFVADPADPASEGHEACEVTCCNNVIHVSCLHRWFTSPLQRREVGALGNGPPEASCPFCRAPCGNLARELARCSSGAPMLARERKEAAATRDAELLQAMERTRGEEGTALREVTSRSFIGDSTLGAETGFGLFAAKELKHGDVIGKVPSCESVLRPDAALMPCPSSMPKTWRASELPYFWNWARSYGVRGVATPTASG